MCGTHDYFFSIVATCGREHATCTVGWPSQHVENNLLAMNHGETWNVFVSAGGWQLLVPHSDCRLVQKHQMKNRIMFKYPFMCSLTPSAHTHMTHLVGLSPSYWWLAELCRGSSSGVIDRLFVYTQVLREKRRAYIRQVSKITAGCGDR